jgi:hypothetical protein
MLSRNWTLFVSFIAHLSSVDVQNEPKVLGAVGRLAFELWTSTGFVRILEISHGVFQDLKSLGKSVFVIMAMEMYVLAVNQIK